MEENIILYGAGKSGEEAYSEFGQNVYCFCDSAKEKIDSICCGKKICDVNKILKPNEYIYIVCINSDSDEIVKEQLVENGIKKVITYRQWKYLKLLHDKSISQMIDNEKKGIRNTFFGNEDDKTIADMINICVSGEKALFIYEDEIEQLQEIEGDIIIVSEKYHLAYEQLLYKQKKNGAKFEIVDLYKSKMFGHSGELVVEASETPSTEDGWKAQILRQREKYNDTVSKFISVVEKEIPLFKLIEIETINRCNGVCSFCPVNRNEDVREKAIMDEALFEKIIMQLESLNYDGAISLFSNNEPLLDDRIIRFHKYARKHLPDARIHMLTNGLLLTSDIFNELINYIDELIIDNYNQNLQLIPSVARLVDEISTNKDLIEKVTIFKRRPFEVLSSRGGNANNKDDQIDMSGIKCIYPYQQLVVRPTGKVSLCCNDPLGKYTMGDLNKETLLEVWYGKEFDEARRKLSIGRAEYGNCKKCDSLHIYN